MAAVQALAAFFVLALLAAGVVALIRAKSSPALTIIWAPIAIGLTIWVTTELLSLTIGISTVTLWASAGLALIALAVRGRLLQQGARQLTLDARGVAAILTSTVKQAGWARWWIIAATALTILALIVTVFLAIWGPPNNADSMGYHLPRVMQWLQNGSVDHYPTPDPRQLVMPPLSSYFLLFLLGMGGSDLFLNTVQWWAALWAALVVGLIARRLTGRWLTTLIAVIFTATIPIGLAEATTTQNDWLAALWVLVTVAIVIERAQRAITLRQASLAIATTMLLAMATKPSGAISAALAVALGAILELRELKRDATRSLGAAVLLSASGVIGLLIGWLPQTIRNMSTYGTPMGADMGVLSQRLDATTLAGNVIRTVANNIGLPAPIATPLNDRLPDLFALLHIPWTDPAAVNFNAVLAIAPGRNEDFASNPIHLLLGLIAAALVVLSRRTPSLLRAISALTIVMFLTGVFIWQWNVWTNRFLLQQMALASIALAYLCARAITANRQPVPKGKPTAMGVAATALIIITSLYGLFIATTMEYRPLIGANSVLTTPRHDRYFTVIDRPGAPDPTRADIESVIAALGDPPAGSTIAMSGVYGQEYALWVLLNPDLRYRLVNAGTEAVAPGCPDTSTTDGRLALTVCER